MSDANCQYESVFSPHLRIQFGLMQRSFWADAISGAGLTEFRFSRQPRVSIFERLSPPTVHRYDLQTVGAAPWFLLEVIGFFQSFIGPVNARNRSSAWKNIGRRRSYLPPH
jgi:hypothetical protein